MDISSLRKRFPSLSREQAGKDVIYLDGPAGTQVPQTVVDGISEVMLHHNANRHGHFATSLELGATLPAPQKNRDLRFMTGKAIGTHVEAIDKGLG
jgi:selenocysteine lyase/cysteine desulfurase